MPTRAVLYMLLWLGLPPAAFAGSFEGVVTMKQSVEGETTIQKTYFKGNKVRIDDPDGDYSVGDAGKQESFLTRKGSKSYIVIPWQGIHPEMKLFNDVAVTRTGKKATVAGYPCDIYLSKDQEDHSEMEACIAKGISNEAYHQWLVTMSPEDVPVWVSDLLKGGGFVLRAINRDAAGKVESTEEATKIEARKLDARLFAPPVGFKKIDEAVMMQQLQMEPSRSMRGKGRKD